jgi:hypothetical protein
VRIRQGDEWKTAFRSRFGTFEYNVVSFGLSNAPSAFQYFMNDILREFLGKFVVVYLDDILIYSKNPADHDNHVRAVLTALERHSLVVNPAKCSFDLQEIDFLGHIISPSGVSMDPVKTAAIASWESPKNVKDVQVFLGFANYYRRFIWQFSKVVQPLTSLLRKDITFDWTPACNAAFEDLKNRFASAPILRHFDFSRPAIVECDASDFACGGILSQVSDDGVMHPCAFFSRKFLPAEANYDIHDKELLAIIESLSAWRHYLIPHTPDSPFLILSDHANLLHFAKRQHLSRRQFRWVEFLSQFSFKISHVPGKANGKADALSRRSQYEYTSGDVHLSQNVRQIFSPDDDASFLKLMTPVIINSISSSFTSNFIDLVRKATKSSSLFADFSAKSLDPTFTSQDGLLFRNGFLVIPDLDLQIQILRARHDSPTAGHYGVAKTFELISRDYYWPGLRRSIRKYIRGCDICSRAKAERHKPYGLLQPLPIPADRWQDLSMDFITDLPLSDDFDSILVVKDRLTKQAHYIPCHKSIDGSETASLFIREIFRHHGFPKTIVSDRGPQFVSKFWKRLFSLLKVDIRLSTSFHPETDGSSEVTNQILEQYLRIFCNYQQSDWVRLLPLAEFTYNNSVNAVTNMTPFFANNGFHPIFDPATPTSSVVPSAEVRVDEITKTTAELRAEISYAQERYSHFANRDRLPAPDFPIGSLVFLNRRNIKTSRPCRKFDDKKLGPFRVIEKINPVAFRLALPASMKTHPVFHVSLLTPKSLDVFPQQVVVPPHPVRVDDHDEFIVESILDTRTRRGQIEYLIHWKGYSPADRTWEPAANLVNAPAALSRFLASRK